ncbi:MAG: HD domain-containing protein, partial [Burkholderiaceae bacterium]|nr:HD domain-containing protein [Burkholderiaceae bacterium]
MSATPPAQLHPAQSEKHGHAASGAPDASAAAADPDQGLRARARAFAEPLIASEYTLSGENLLEHADALADILDNVGASQTMQAAAYLSYASKELNHPEEVLRRAFGPELANLALESARLAQVQERSRTGLRVQGASPEQKAHQTEAVRKMLLAFSRDLRVVLLRLASRLQTLRWFARNQRVLPPSLLRESREVFGPLANRLGIWQIKWEMEDLVFRAQEPETYRQVATMLDERRAEREAALQARRAEIEAALRGNGIAAEVTGRPKHIYSIVRKMRGKNLAFDQVFDLRALRVLTPTVDDCYAALSWVHEHFAPVPGEFDDYIAKPKINGYQSLHTVVRDAAGKAWEIQIRTRQMHEHAEHGVAAHWAYKEAGIKGYGGGVTAGSSYDAKIAMLRQLLAWGRDLSEAAAAGQGLFDDRIYVLTPDASVVELPSGATAVDFAYAVHTELGHRCRGARVDGAMAPLNTPLQNGQTVEITAAKEGGPSRDWLNADLHFLASPRARAKVRAWFNAQQTRETVARGREMVEKLLQREGKTALSLDTLAAEMGFKTPDALFETVGKDELSLRSIETVLRPRQAQQAAPDADAALLQRKAAGTAATSSARARSGVLVVGLDSLMTQPAGCCKPAPPDPIAGYVTRGRGVSVHRKSCPSFLELQARAPDRVIEVDWAKKAQAYPVDVAILATDRQG